MYEHLEHLRWATIDALMPIFWLASYPKSGNTWLRLLIANVLHDTPIGINDLANAGMAYQDTSWYLWKPFLGGDSDHRLRLRPEIQRRFAARFKDQTVFMKTHAANMFHEDGTPAIAHDVSCGAVYLVRDPRNVCISYARHANWSLDETARFMCDETSMLDSKGVLTMVSDWSAHVSSWLDAGAHVVAYEDLVEDTKKALSAVFGAILPPRDDAKSILRAVDRCELWKLQCEEAQNGFVESVNSTFFNGNTDHTTVDGDWKRKIEDCHGDLMARLGYYGKSHDRAA